MKTIIVGLGNPLFGDDSVGPQVAHSLKKIVAGQANITIVEACMSGLDILDLVSGFDKAIIIDAVQTQQGKPGQIHRLKLDQLTTNVNSAPHEIDFVTAFEMGRKLDLALPEDVLILAVEIPEVSGFAECCSPAIAEAVLHCVEMIVQEVSGDQSAQR